MRVEDLQPTTLITDPKRAYYIASKCKAIICQEWKSVKDGITAVALGSAPKVLSNLMALVDDPVLYFSVRENDEVYFIMYMVYHPFDYSEFNFDFPLVGEAISGLIQKWDSHRHDTEVFVLKKYKKSNRVDCISVFHYQFIFKKGIESDKKVYILIQKEGHGIKPITKEDFIKTCLSKDVRTYHKYRLENMLEWTEKNWENLRKEFNSYGVKMPDEHYDGVLKLNTHIGRVKRLKGSHLPGDLWYKPELTFNQMEF